MLEAHDLERYTRQAAHLAKLQMEVLSVYRPTPQQLPFHESGAHQLVLRGGKRSGKSTAAAVEFASRVMGEPVIGPDNKPLPLKYSAPTAEDPKLYWIIGWEVKHIGQTIYRLLFEPGMRGQFRIIQDKKTGNWRTFNPSLPGDMKRRKQSVLAPPLIPPRMIKPGSWCFDSKAGNVFETVELVNGAKICAFPSSSPHAKQGDAVAGIWIDEDIQNENHFSEWEDRLTDEDGWLLWSVWPHVANHALIRLLDKAEETVADPKANVQQVQLVMSENPFFTEESKERSLERMGSEDEIARRDRGELLWESMMMYDFSPYMHVLKPEAVEKPQCSRDAIVNELAQKKRLPQHWTRYLAIDPSHTRTAVVVGAVPPPYAEGVPLGNRLVIEFEYVALRQSADQLASALAAQLSGLHFESFVMDQNAGRQTSAGRQVGQNTFAIYSAAFAKHGLVSRQTKHGFIPGCNVPQRRYAAMRQLMLPQEDGWPTLWLIGDRTWTTQKEFHTYRKKQMKIGGEEVMVDEPANPRVHDLMAAVEYLVAHLFPLFESGTAYVPPENVRMASPALRGFESWKKRQAEQNEEYVHLGPGSRAA